MEIRAEFVGGRFDRQNVSLSELEGMGNGRRTQDMSEYRAKGRTVGRAELDNQPIVDGYIGPMWDGVRYVVDGKLCYSFEVSEEVKATVEPIGIIRYETPEVYNFLCQ